MEVRRIEVSEFSFPFSELIKGNYFTLESTSVEPAPVFVKTGTFNYSTSDNEQNFSIIDDGIQVHRTKVRLANNNLFD